MITQRLPGEPITIAVIGCGQRGKSYAKYALQSPDRCKIVAIAEPRPETQKHFAKLHSVDNTLVFQTWRDLHAASAETISTVTVAFAEQGYHILCEKPMATKLSDCIKMQNAVKKAGIIFGLGHVMRYSPYSQEISAIVESGTLGKLINIVQVEPIGHWHYAHSYVRGNWSNEGKSAFSLMTKSCHDIDIICHWLSASAPSRVSSFGSLTHFRKSEKPKEAGPVDRCLDCPAEKKCPYSAKRIYLEPVSKGNTDWPAEVLVDGLPDIENITDALKNGPYGKCVYESENDVCDNQIVNMEFANGSTASFTMIAFTSLICDRQLRMHFSHGEIVGDMHTFTVTDFRTGASKKHAPKADGSSGHGGGDMGLIRTFVEAVRSEDQRLLRTDIDEIVKSHLTVFAAEASRREGRVVDCVEFERKARLEVEQASGDA
ncbi:streptomycin biosynthesis protein StrI [Mucidula mucida]|nr:streptomycin biosynthesis protein StrI [Mucidula mucida]